MGVDASAGGPQPARTIRRRRAPGVERKSPMTFPASRDRPSGSVRRPGYPTLDSSVTSLRDDMSSETSTQTQTRTGIGLQSGHGRRGLRLSCWWLGSASAAIGGIRRGMTWRVRGGSTRRLRVSSNARACILNGGRTGRALSRSGSWRTRALGGLESRLGRWGRFGLIGAAGIATCGLIRWVQLGRSPALGHLVLPDTRLRPWKLGRSGLCRWSTFGALARAPTWGGVGGGRRPGLGGGWLSFQKEPLAFEPTLVSMGESRGLANALRGTRDGADWARRVRLSGQELNQMIVLGVSRVAPPSKVRFKIEGGGLKATSPMP